MEAILNSLMNEKRKVYIPWKQIGGAIVLALAASALCIGILRGKTVFDDKVKPVMGIGNMESVARIKLTIQELTLLNGSDELLHLNSESADSVTILPKVSGMDEAAKSVPVKVKTKEAVQENAGRKEANRQIAVTDKKTVSEAKESDKSVENNEENLPLVSEISLELYGNGGMPGILRETCSVDEFDIEKYEQPERLGKLFDGWYIDKNCSIPFEALDENVTSLKLYAGWKEFPGFISNDSGHIIGYTDDSKFLGDNLMVLPSYKTCTGIEKGAINGLEEDIYEIYFPANITYIETEMFDKLPNLLYIQVQSGNPEFYSKNGKLYYKSGELVASPKGLE